MNGREVHYSTNPDAVYVSIYCAGNVVRNDAGEVEQSHQDEPWLIASFRWTPEDLDNLAGAWFWSEELDYWRDHTPAFRLAGRSARRLVGDRHVSQADYRADPLVFDGGSRTRYRFECRTCGLTIERKAPTVEAAFQKLAVAGVLEVSLRALGSIL